MLFTGCQNGGKETSSGQSDSGANSQTQYTDGPRAALERKDSIVVGTVDFNGLFSPLFATSAYDRNVYELVIESLLDNDEHGNIIDGIASYQLSENGLSYTFTIQDGIRYTGGESVQASDFELALRIFADPEYDGPLDYSKYGIVGFDEYRSGEAESISGVTVKDEKTLEITLEAPNASALYGLGDLPALDPSYYGKAYEEDGIAGLKRLNSAPKGSGQYIFEEYKEGQSVTLKANEDYYKGKPNIGAVVFSVTPSNKELERVMVGETDLDMANPEPETVEEAKDSGFITPYLFPTNGFGYIGINNSDPKYQDKRVRQALVYALNREAIVEAIYGEYATPINIPQSSESWVYSDEGIEDYSYDLEKAAQLLADAGWVMGDDGVLAKDGVRFVVNFTAMGGHAITEPMLPVMKDDYKKIGIELNIDTAADYPTIVNKVNSGQCEMWFMAWELSADPDLTNLYTTNGAQNNLNYSNPALDELAAQALQELDQDKRKELYQEIYQIWNEDVPAILVYQRNDMWIVNNRIENFKVSPYRRWTKDLWQMSIKQ